MEDITKLDSNTLVDEYEFAVKQNHYDPMGHMRQTMFDVYDLKKEILRRLKQREAMESMAQDY